MYYYNPRQMLFQNLTRAREKIKIIIINNIDLYKKMNKVLTNSSDKNELSFKFFMPELNNDKLKSFYSNILGFSWRRIKKVHQEKERYVFK